MLVLNATYEPINVCTVRRAVVLMLIGLLASGLSTGLRLLALGIGAIALFIGFSMLAPKLVPPLVRVLGWPASKIGGSAGKLAQANSARNPARTASTASALMIGLALVTLVGTYAVVFGVLVTALGFRVHLWATREKRELTGGTPAHAV